MSFFDESPPPRTHLLTEQERWEPSHRGLIGAFKDGSKALPYGVWRRFLVLTGRVPQEIIPVLAFMV